MVDWSADQNLHHETLPTTADRHEHSSTLSATGGPARAGASAARLWRNPMARIGMMISAVVVLAAIFGPPLAPYDPVAIKLADRFQAPSRTI